MRIQDATRLTNEAGFSEWPTWSPDGKLFAYSSNRTGNFEIYVRRVDAGEDVNVTRNDADDVQPAFSPDGTSIAFVSSRSSRTGLIRIGGFIGFDTRTFGGDIWLTPPLGGQPRRLAEDGNFPVWHPNGRSLLYVTGSENRRTILEVSADGGRPKAVLAATASRWEIIRLGYAPNARWITFETEFREVLVMPAHGGSPALLFRGSGHVWDPGGGRIYYVNQLAGGGTRLEIAELKESGDGLTTTRTTFAGVSTGTLKGLAIAGDTQQMLAVGFDESLNLSRMPLTADGTSVAGPEEQLSHGQVRDRFPSVSPDNNRIAVSSNRIGENQLWQLELSSRQWSRVVQTMNATTRVSQACWAKDGQHLALVRRLEDGKTALVYIALDGSSSEELRPPQPALNGSFACDFSPDGRRIVYPHMAGAFSQLFAFDLSSRTERQLTTSPSHKYQGSWSPDGRWLAFSANTGGTIHIWRMPVDGGPEQQLTQGLERNLHFFYSPDGRLLYVQPSHKNIWRMPADGGPLQQVTHFPESGLFLEEPTISPDGRWLVYNKGGGGASLWMLTIGSDAEPTS
jgi:Tol biopolymer transport system component